MPAEEMRSVDSSKSFVAFVPVPWTKTIPGTRPRTPTGVVSCAGIDVPSLKRTCTCRFSIRYVPTGGEGALPTTAVSDVSGTTTERIGSGFHRGPAQFPHIPRRKTTRIHARSLGWRAGSARASRAPASDVEAPSAPLLRAAI